VLILEVDKVQKKVLMNLPEGILGLWSIIEKNRWASPKVKLQR
jgi:hypothetical protein